MDKTASWTKHAGEWAVSVPQGATVTSGDKIKVVSKAGAEKTVTVAEQVASKPWGAIWTLAKTAQTEAVAEGYYFANDAVYKVRTSKTGNRYATVLVKRGNRGAWDYQPGAIKHLTAEHAITVEQAAEYGHLHGFCAICGKTLTDPASVERGIGPVCAKKIAPVAESDAVKEAEAILAEAAETETETLGANPWKEQHLADEGAFTDSQHYTPSLAAQVVAHEYRGHETPEPCEQPNCDGKAWWWATVGVYKCAKCGEMNL